jgi:hypothetical protein
MTSWLGRETQHRRGYGTTSKTLIRKFLQALSGETMQARIPPFREVSHFAQSHALPNRFAVSPTPEFITDLRNKAALIGIGTVTFSTESFACRSNEFHRQAN